MYTPIAAVASARTGSHRDRVRFQFQDRRVVSRTGTAVVLLRDGAATGSRAYSVGVFLQQKAALLYLPAIFGLFSSGSLHDGGSGAGSNEHYRKIRSERRPSRAIHRSL